MKLEGAESYKDSKNFFNDKENLNELREEVKQERENMRKGGRGGTSLPADAAIVITEQIAAAVESGKPIAAKTVEHYLAAISKDEKLSKIFAETFASQATADLENIKEQSTIR